MMKLETSHFTDFFDELWKCEPFAWQKGLLARVIEEGSWPDLVDIPTGMGKTATIDIALFALAFEATNEPNRAAWRFPRRIVMVVDRRVIVDQAYDRASKIEQAIKSADAGTITHTVGEALARCHAPDGPYSSSATPPLLTSVLRGGIIRDEEWSRRPDVPAVVASTVDQVGSRLVFRGYGVQPRARAIQAGLLGSDTLFLLDEVHLAQPFAETLAAVHDAAQTTENPPMSGRLFVTQLTATPAFPVKDRFPQEPLTRPALTAADLPRLQKATTAQAFQERRLGNSKPADLVLVKTSADAAKSNQALAREAVKQVGTRLKGATRAAIIVNRVDTARRVFKLLRSSTDEDQEQVNEPPFDVVLLTGRMRPADRDALLNGPDKRGGIARRLRTGPRGKDERPIVVVATQSLEAGADFDFDFIVTECASLDALKQRFGRVDRDGQRWANGALSRSAILCRSTDASDKGADPVYGTALKTTWDWLSERPLVDFGYGAMPLPEGDRLIEILPPRRQAPRLAASHLDRWAQTSEREMAAEPIAAQWLHGIDVTDEVADVQVVWRDLPDPSLFHWGYPTEQNEEELSSLVSEQLSVLPPLAAEALSVPIRDVRLWLRGEGADPQLSDAPATRQANVDNGRHHDRLVARWASEAAEIIPAEQIRPGDTIVVPSIAGGLTAGNWDPTSQAPVTDISRELAREIRGTIVVPLSQEICAACGEEWPDPEDLGDMRMPEMTTYLKDLVRRHPETFEEVPPDSEAKGWKAQAIPVKITSVDGRKNTVQRQYELTAQLVKSEKALYADDETSEDAASLIGRPIWLSSHLRGVGAAAEAFAKALGWDERLARSLKLAGELHDVGKADPRFQLILAGGATFGCPLAKSGSTSGTPTTRRAAYLAAGYPRGTRHELMSVAMIEGVDLGDSVDGELVRFLIAGHHGWGRYRFNPVTDYSPAAVELPVDTCAGSFVLRATTDHGLYALDSGQADRYWNLTRRYGWWNLAYIEAVFRLADHYRSSLEERGHVEPEAMAEPTKKERS